MTIQETGRDLKDQFRGHQEMISRWVVPDHSLGRWWKIWELLVSTYGLGWRLEIQQLRSCMGEDIDMEAEFVSTLCSLQHQTSGGCLLCPHDGWLFTPSYSVLSHSFGWLLHVLSWCALISPLLLMSFPCSQIYYVRHCSTNMYIYKYIYIYILIWYLYIYIHREREIMNIDTEQ